MTLNIMRYVLEVVTYIAVSLVFIVYTEKVYILPVLAKTVVTIITWINMKRVYKNSFGTFYTKETEAIIYWRNKEIWRVLLDLSCVLKNQRNAWHLMDTWHWIYCGDWCLEWVLQCPDVTSFTLHNVHMFPHQTWAELEWTHDHSSLLTQSYSDTACLTTNHLLIITCKLRFFCIKLTLFHWLVILSLFRDEKTWILIQLDYFEDWKYIINILALTNQQ